MKLSKKLREAMEITFSIILWLTVAGLMGLGILTIWNIVVYGYVI